MRMGVTKSIMDDQITLKNPYGFGEWMNANKMKECAVELK
mgnify:CR=1 FL=1